MIPFARHHERFWSKVDKTDTCWLWTRSLNHCGYGQFSYYNQGRSIGIMVHRWAYMELVGLIPVGLQLDHLCKIRNCVNPKHLEPVTRRENIRRSEAISVVNSRKTHCPKGHPYDAINTRIIWRRGLVNGERECRACRKVIDARRSIRRSAARQQEAQK